MSAFVSPTCLNRVLKNMPFPPQSVCPAACLLPDVPFVVSPWHLAHPVDCLTSCPAPLVCGAAVAQQVRNNVAFVAGHQLRLQARNRQRDGTLKQLPHPEEWEQLPAAGSNVDTAGAATGGATAATAGSSGQIEGQAGPSTSATPGSEEAAKKAEEEEDEETKEEKTAAKVGGHCN